MNSKNSLNLYIDRLTINKRVRELADRISKDYKGKVPIFIGVLNGAFIFMSDLDTQVKLDTEIDFLKLSSYGEKKISSGNVRLLKDMNCPIKNRHIIIVEDIVDSGLSVNFIKNIIEDHKPASLSFATLLFKKGLSNLDFNIKYVGFKIPNKFVVGYGLDYAQKYRNLKSL